MSVGRQVAIENAILQAEPDDKSDLAVKLKIGRALFPGDREFGQWVEKNVLYQLGKA